MADREIRFGVIGCGLMGREFASAAARWMHLENLGVRPKIVAACDPDSNARQWFESNIDLELSTPSHNDLVAHPGVEAIYCAVPHDLHERIMLDILKAGKHLMAEKPFGIDLDANRRIIEEIGRHPELLVRCSSEFPFYPGAQRIIAAACKKKFGRILEVRAGFWHSSDVDPKKPMNWKRRRETCGEYGCMGDLGLHVVHLPFRLGWQPLDVRAFLSNIVEQRPGGGGQMEACDTWDNALLACEATDGIDRFPMLIETKRIAPGEMNTWYIRVLGTEFSAEFSTKHPKTLRTMTYDLNQAQAWCEEDLGYSGAYPAITGGIFEFGFPDAILQMWAAFCDELAHGDHMRQPFCCATPNETLLSHKLFTAALKSARESSTVRIES